MGFTIEKIGPTYQDNYVYILNDQDSSQTIVLDPPPNDAVLEYLTSHKRELIQIFNTHHHPDHAGGIAELKERFSAEVLGPEDSPIASKLFDHTISDGEEFSVFGVPGRAKILLGHLTPLIAYYFPSVPALFCSDIVFSLGCGRNFTGTLKDLYESLQWVKQLPKETLLYCSHEYTVSNGQFALSVEPNNHHLQKRVQEAIELQKSGHPTVPSTVESEQLCNPFFRPDSTEIRKALGLDLSTTTDQEVVTKLRQRKDKF